MSSVQHLNQRDHIFKDWQYLAFHEFISCTRLQQWQWQLEHLQFTSWQQTTNSKWTNNHIHNWFQKANWLLYPSHRWQLYLEEFEVKEAQQVSGIKRPSEELLLFLEKKLHVWNQATSFYSMHVTCPSWNSALENGQPPT